MFLTNIDERISVVVGGHEYQVARARLGKFLLLEQLRAEKNIKGFLEACALPLDKPGLDLLRAYDAIIRFNAPRLAIPFLVKKSTEKHEAESWEYPSRWLIGWIHQVASAYHWSRSEILDLEVEEFLAYVQEILVDKQFDREWHYSLTDFAYRYDEASKTSTFVPLKRPIWMQKIPDKPRNTPIPKSLMPAGLVIEMNAGALA